VERSFLEKAATAGSHAIPTVVTVVAAAEALACVGRRNTGV
jgi:hypothetical protein